MKSPQSIVYNSSRAETVQKKAPTFLVWLGFSYWNKTKVLFHLRVKHKVPLAISALSRGFVGEQMFDAIETKSRFWK